MTTHDETDQETLPAEQQDEYRVAAITGAGSGIGQALAVILALRGYHLALSDITQAGLDETIRHISHTGVRASATLVDVADAKAVNAWAQEVVSTFGRVNMLFNNAGVTVVDSAERISMENFRWLMDINFWGVVHGTQAFLPYLKEADEAHIINTSSIFGIVAAAGQAAYNASKFAVRGYTEALKQELADTNIKVSCVIPGGVKTGIIEHSRYYAEDNEAPTKEEMDERFQQNAALLPKQAASEILAGIDQGKAQILVGKDAQLLALGQRLMPEKYPILLQILRRLWGDKERAS